MLVSGKKSVPSRGNDQCKGPEVEECLYVKRVGRKSG